MTLLGVAHHHSAMDEDPSPVNLHGSSPVGRGGAGFYIEGELGAFYLLTMLADSEPRGMPGTRLTRVAFQGADRGFALDDIILHCASNTGETLLEIQSKRTITFSPKDSVFEEVCGQIARSNPFGGEVAAHRMAVATQRISHAISGPYQDVLEWARTAENGPAFFKRLNTKGVAGEKMRAFGDTFRQNLVSAGVEDGDETIWRIMRRFLILEFDFESSAPLARTHALILAQLALAIEDSSRAEALWHALVSISGETAKSGGSLQRDELRAKLRDQGFHLSGDRSFSSARAKLAEYSNQALAEIGTTVANLSLPRTAVIEALDKARDERRFVQITGSGGVGKSAVLRAAAQRVARHAHIFVLDPLNTPEGGWSALALRLGIQSTAREFLGDLASSGGGTLFIDSLEMFVSPGQQRTVNDLLREIAPIDGFSVVATARTEFGADGGDWLAKDAVATLGLPTIISIGELFEDEVETLREQAPELRALLAPGHPAAKIARNLYRLNRLLRVPASATIRSEAELADSWWGSGGYAPSEDKRSAQRIIADLADAAIIGSDFIELRDDTLAREHLLHSQSLKETRRDRLGFYHDVLRDWAVGARLTENPDIIAGVDLNAPVSPRIARGVEFAARFALEEATGCQTWLSLLVRLSPEGAHGSWRRQALLAIVRSERSPELLERCSSALLANDGLLLNELITAIVAVETVSSTEVMKGLAIEPPTKASPPSSLRVATTPSSLKLLVWCLHHANEIAICAIAPVVKLVQITLPIVARVPEIGRSTAGMLFHWLLQLDVRDANVTIPPSASPDWTFSDDRRRLVGDLRTMALVLSSQAPDQLKAYLRALAAENDIYKTRQINKLSPVIARDAPQELADLIIAALIEPDDDERCDRYSRRQALSFYDSDYLPASPAQPPFLDLLEASPEVGLTLIRRLVDQSVLFHSRGKAPGNNGFTLVLDDAPRFFPWTDTYLWSRDQAHEDSVASGLMALEAWAHGRVEAGDDISVVLKDVLGPTGSPAAYLLVAIDLLISHWPASRDLLVPFIGNPDLLAIERRRGSHDHLISTRLPVGEEPKGKVRLADLQAKPSRGVPLERFLPGYLGHEETSNRVRSLLDEAVSRLGPYGENADFCDPAFMGAHARNVLDPTNWERQAYQSPQAEIEHLAKLEQRHSSRQQANEIEMRVLRATDDAAKGSAELARKAVTYARCAALEEDDARMRSTRLAAIAMLAARDGDDALLDEQEAWIRNVIARSLAGKKDRFGARDSLTYNRPALATLALIHLWRRKGLTTDRNQLLALACRDDRSAVPAFLAARDIVGAIDARVIKSVIRIGFQASRWRWHPWDEEAEQTEAYEQRKNEDDVASVNAEIAWLGGAAEPAWSTFPDEVPTIREGFRIRLPGPEDPELKPVERPAPVAIVRADSQSAALWLKLITGDQPRTNWCSEIVDAYAEWSARANGLGCPAGAEVDREPREWNGQFYRIVATDILTGTEQRFDELVKQIELLPDRSFGHVGEVLLHEADAWYFNDPKRSSSRPATLRARLVSRTLELSSWRRGSRAGNLSVASDMGGIVAQLLMNFHDPFHGARSYLVPAVFDRVDPLLEVVRPMISSGPTQFVALCTMNTLLVAPRARHIEFLLAAVAAWSKRLPTDAGMWIELGLGRKVMQWLDAVVAEDPGMLARDHPMRSLIELAIGRLVTAGVAEAHEFEKRLNAT